ncbi:MAG: hypothetical protein ACKVRP_06730 [Bacteroidota bacterium]
MKTQTARRYRQAVWTVKVIAWILFSWFDFAHHDEALQSMILRKKAGLPDFNP